MKNFSSVFLILIMLLLSGALIGVLPFEALAVTPQEGLNATANNAFGGTIPLANINKASLPSIIGGVVNFVLTFVGALFFGLIVWGGLLWMTARGNDKQIGDAQKIMKNAAYGLVIVMAAYAITAFVIAILTTPK
jgi:hypothetical protein